MPKKVTRTSRSSTRGAAVALRQCDEPDALCSPEYTLTEIELQAFAAAGATRLAHLKHSHNEVLGADIATHLARLEGIPDDRAFTLRDFARWLRLPIADCRRLLCSDERQDEDTPTIWCPSKETWHAALSARRFPEHLRYQVMRVVGDARPDQKLEVVDELMRASGRRYTGGRPHTGNVEAAKKAYVDALERGDQKKAAVAAAKAAGGFRSDSRIYELKKEQRWDELVPQNRLR